MSAGADRVRDVAESMSRLKELRNCLYLLQPYRRPRPLVGVVASRPLID